MENLLSMLDIMIRRPRLKSCREAEDWCVNTGLRVINFHGQKVIFEMDFEGVRSIKNGKEKNSTGSIKKDWSKTEVQNVDEWNLPKKVAVEKYSRETNLPNISRHVESSTGASYVKKYLEPLGYKFENTSVLKKIYKFLIRENKIYEKECSKKLLICRFTKPLDDTTPRTPLHNCTIAEIAIMFDSLLPKLTETSRCNKLVLQHFGHNNRSAISNRSFRKEKSKAKKKCLRMKYYNKFIERFDVEIISRIPPSN